MRLLFALVGTASDLGVLSVVVFVRFSLRVDFGNCRVELVKAVVEAGRFMGCCESDDRQVRIGVAAAASSVDRLSLRARWHWRFD